MLTPPDEGPRVKGQRIRLQDIIDGEYNPLRVNGTWVGGKRRDAKFLIIWLYSCLMIRTKPSPNIWVFILYFFSLFFLWFSLAADEFLYQNQWGGISILNVAKQTERILMSNTTFVSILSCLSLSWIFVRKQSISFMCLCAEWNRQKPDFNWKEKHKLHQTNWFEISILKEIRVISFWIETVGLKILFEWTFLKEQSKVLESDLSWKLLYKLDLN